MRPWLSKMPVVAIGSRVAITVASRRLLLGLAALLLVAGCSRPEAAWPDGVVVAPGSPAQSPTSVRGWPYVEQSRITPVADYEITARVLSVKYYKPGSDPLSAFSPMDFALGWGEMSRSEVIKGLSIHQGTRFYSYQWDGPAPAAPLIIAISSANTHLIPADPDVARRLYKVRAGDKVRLSGQLVNVQSAALKGQARSSLVRTDVGPGACEIMWVTGLDHYPAP